MGQVLKKCINTKNELTAGVLQNAGFIYLLHINSVQHTCSSSHSETVQCHLKSPVIILPSGYFAISKYKQTFNGALFIIRCNKYD